MTNNQIRDQHDQRPKAGAARADLVDVRDMLVVHTAMLREFRLASAAVNRVTPGDRKQAGVVAEHIQMMCDLLHHHHDGEDVLLWPKLRDRAPAAIETIEQVEEQHSDIDAALARVRPLLTVWASDPAAGYRDPLAADLDRLHALLRDHLDLEERTLLPVAASVLTDAEWNAVGEAASRAMPKPLLMLVFGMFAYEGDPAVLAQMLHSAPRLPQLLLPRIAPRVYARRARRVHGTPTP